MRTALRKMGNSAGVIVPKAILNQLGIRLGATYDVSVDGDRIVFAPATESNHSASSADRAANAPDKKAAELEALAAELEAAAGRMADRLDRAVNKVRNDLDAEQEAKIRRRYEAEFSGQGDTLLAGLI